MMKMTMVLMMMLVTLPVWAQPQELPAPAAMIYLAENPSGAGPKDVVYALGFVKVSVNPPRMAALYWVTPGGLFQPGTLRIAVPHGSKNGDLGVNAGPGICREKPFAFLWPGTNFPMACNNVSSVGDINGDGLDDFTCNMLSTATQPHRQAIAVNTGLQYCR